VSVAVRRFTDLAAAVLDRPGPVRLVGVDGCAGAGKTTFAARLAAAADGCPVVHTDDFSSFEAPMQWWPQLLGEVIEPLLRGETASFHPYDWVARRRSDETIVVPPAPLVVIEGVGATRAAWRDVLAMRVWVDAPRAVRLERGLARDGAHMHEFWTWWMAQEDDYVSAEQPFAHADLVVDGAAAATGDPIPSDPDEYVEIPLSAPR
jgi:uridine kinase